MVWEVIEGLALVGIAVGSAWLFGGVGLIVACVLILALSFLVNRPEKGGKP